MDSKRLEMYEERIKILRSLSIELAETLATYPLESKEKELRSISIDISTYSTILENMINTDIKEELK